MADIRILNRRDLLGFALYHVFSRIPNVVFLFIANIYAARIFNKADFSQIQFLSWAVSFSWLIFNLGGPAVLFQYLSGAGSLTPSSRRFTLGIMAISISAAVISWVICIRLTENNLPASAWLYLISFFIASYLQVLMQAMLFFRQIFFVSTCSFISGTCILFFMPSHHGINGFLLSLGIIQCLLICGYGFVLWQNSAPTREIDLFNENRKDGRLIPNLLFYGISTVLSTIGSQRTELLFIHELLVPERLAEYCIDLALVTICTEFLRWIPPALQPYFSSLKHSPLHLQETLYTFSRYFFWAEIFICLFVAFEAKPLVLFLYGEKYLGSVIYAQILIVGFIPGLMLSILVYLHMALGKLGFLLRQDIITAFVFPTLCIFLVPAYELKGAALSKLVMLIAATLMSLCFTCRQLKFRLPFSYMTCSLIISFAVIIPLHALAANGPFPLFLKGMLAAIIYYKVSASIGVVDKVRITEILKRYRSIPRLDKGSCE